MKKKYILFSLIISFLLVTNINANSKIEVTLNKCVDGDTAWFNMNGEKIKTRFLAIDTPESTNQIEEYGKEASEYVCDLLTTASKIELEYDDASDKTDKYDRHLVWVFVDNELLQEKIVKEGLAEVKYVYGDYKYLDDVNEALDYAKTNKLNIWSDSEESTNQYDYIIVLIGGIVIIVVCIFNKKSRKKVINKTKRKAIKAFENSLKNIK